MASVGTSSFGQLLRQYRVAAALTQEELAAAAALGVRTISDLERGVSLRAHPSTLSQLIEALKISSHDATALEAAWHAAREATAPQTVAPNNVPTQLTSFIGRIHELADLSRALGSLRLITLTGSGGCGKTRLALQVAEEALGAFPDGVWVAELSPLADPDAIPGSIAIALGMRDQSGTLALAALTKHISTRRMLLVLDNCEHLVAACAQVAETLAQACPYLNILATSREPLGIGGERVYRVPSLRVPAPQDSSSVDQVAASEAARLLLDRVAAARPGLTLTPQNAPVIAHICRQLDGIPLALEMVAALARTVPLEQIATRLEDQFAVLTRGSRTVLPRHQTLRAVIDWSHDLLTAQEQVLFRRLSVFSGGWTLDAAEDVCADDALPKAAILDALSRLADKSLVQIDQREDEVRYTLLETVRQYARERLDAAGEAATVRGRHLRWYVDSPEVAMPPVPGATRTLRWASQWVTEHYNLQAALSWSQESANIDAELHLVSVLNGPWADESLFYSPLAHRRIAIADVLSRSDPARRTLARARALFVAAQLAGMQEDITAAADIVEESIAIYREVGSQEETAFALLGWGRMLALRGDREASERVQDEIVATFRASGDDFGMAVALFLWGDALMGSGDYAGARAQLEKAMALFHTLGHQRMVTRPMLSLARVACAEGDYQRGLRLATTCLEIRRETELENLEFVANALISLGEAERCMGRDVDAKAHFEAGLASFQQAGDASGVVWATHNLAHLVLHAGDLPLAATQFAEVLRGRHKQQHFEGTAAALAGLASVALQESRHTEAVRLAGALTRLLGKSHLVLVPADQLVFDRDVAFLREQLAPDAFAAAWAAGEALTLDVAVAEALG